MPDADRLQTDYRQTTDLIRELRDIRFKLIALVPSLSGAAVAVLGRKATGGALLAVGALGLLATLGVLLYELRNTQLYEYALDRATRLERQLALASAFDGDEPGGLYSERPGHQLRILGLTAGQERGLSLVYGAAIGGWSYLFAWGALHALSVSNAQRLGGVVAVLAAVAVVIAFLRIDSR